MDSVEGAAVEPATTLVGQGQMPTGFDRFSWAALLAGPLWALIHGAWWWLGALVALRIITIALSRLGLPWAVAVNFGYPLLLVAFATVANRAYWFQRSRLSGEGPGRGQTIAQFISVQHVLVWIGAGATVLSFWAEYGGRSEWSIPPRPPLAQFAAAAAVQVGFLAVAAFVSVFKNRGKPALRS